MMRLEQLEDLLDRRGPAIERWPPAERMGAAALLATSAPARRLLDEALVLERMLGQALAPLPAPPELVSALARLPARAPERRGWPLPAWLAPARLAWGGGLAALAASALLGFWLGAVELAPADDDEVPAIATLAFGSDLDLGDAM